MKITMQVEVTLRLTGAEANELARYLYDSGCGNGSSVPTRVLKLLQSVPEETED